LQLPFDIADSGDRLLVFDQIDSTMEEARRQYHDGLASRTWIVAREQGLGRGRHGRNWKSPAGNLHLTVVFPAPCALRDQPKLGFVAGVALWTTAKALLPAETSVALKWPNDLLLAGAKVAGLLVEGLGNGAAVAIGIGVNIVEHPDNTPYPADHLQSFSPNLTAEDLLQKLSLALKSELDCFSDGSGFPLIRQRWLAAAAHLNQTIHIRSTDSQVQGVFKDIDADGRLLLETANGMVRIDAGDVFPLDK
jgi:BirA family transcriptional regulator, biotin operon repressor / biotin---[acetyl-CoA-carboxylase] ligase